MTEDTPSEQPTERGSEERDRGSTTRDRGLASTTPVVAIDTSALMAPVEADVRLFEELDRLLGTYRAVVPDAVRAELDRLADGNGREATAARVGRDLADRADPIAVTDEPAATEDADDEPEAATDDADGDDSTAETAGRPIDDAGGNGSTNEYADDVLVALAEAGAVAYVVTNDRPLKNRILARNVPVIGLRGRNALAITEP